MGGDRGHKTKRRLERLVFLLCVEEEGWVCLGRVNGGEWGVLRVVSRQGSGCGALIQAACFAAARAADIVCVFVF